jgi:hypothetical protein
MPPHVVAFYKNNTDNLFVWFSKELMKEELEQNVLNKIEREVSEGNSHQGIIYIERGPHN